MPDDLDAPTVGAPAGETHAARLSSNGRLRVAIDLDAIERATLAEAGITRPEQRRDAAAESVGRRVEAAPKEPAAPGKLSRITPEAQRPAGSGAAEARREAAEAPRTRDISQAQRPEALRPTPPTRSRRGLWLMLGTLAAGLAVGLALFLRGATPATTPPPPAEVSVEAELVLELEPANATVTVDGQAARGGKVSGLKLGASVEVVARADGFEPFKKTVTVDSASVKLMITLAPVAARVMAEPSGEPRQDVVAKVAATLKIGLDPSGADVKTSVGTVTMSSQTEAVITGLSQGETVEVTVWKAGFGARKESIAITGAEQTHAVKLTATDAAKPAATSAPAPSAPAPSATAPSAPAPSAAAASAKGTLQIGARPWANVSINGRPAGDTPVVRQLPPGPYKVVLTKGPQSVTKTVRLEAGKTARVDHRFE